MAKQEQAEIRRKLIAEIEADIVGPREGPEESSKLYPLSEYLAGVLYPSNTVLDGKELADEESSSSGISSEDGEVEPQSSSRSLFKQSSFGLTCSLPLGVKTLVAHVEYGTYESQKKDGKTVYKRTPRAEKFNISIEKSGKTPFSKHPNFYITHDVVSGLGGNILDIYVVNHSNNKTSKKNNSISNILFQPKIILESADRQPIFMPMKEEKPISAQEIEPFDLLFHKKISFGKGHLCAVTWDETDVRDRMSGKIQTTFVPIEEVNAIEPTESSAEYTSMTYLANCSDKIMLKNALENLIRQYSDWVAGAEKQAREIEQEYMGVADSAIRRCKKASKRMQKGVDALLNDDDAFQAFKFANLAIAWQLTMSKWAKSNASKGSVDGHEPLDPDKNSRWKIFQIAFILLNLESLINPNSDDRKTVDLLWFPTGGGKTEAYLGLATFLIAYRRLRGVENGQFTSLGMGTSVIMRYTLRLLTVQQFQRAASLMCACEKIRRSNKEKWGEEPFQVGLWVGGNVTPNKREDGLNSAVQKKFHMSENDLASASSNNPYILLNCPWCGQRLKKSNGEVGGKPRQWRLYCGRNSCMFSKHLDVGEDLSLPVVLVDEDIYSRCPSLIISTVDKFAQITWKSECSSIFGRVEKYCRHCGFYNTRTSDSQHTHPGKNLGGEKPTLDVELLPPELIIQDELHLISGPLGSMVGLYETAIEYLCTHDGAKPKIIASTATTKDSPDQIKGLFNRDETEIFPPQVIEFGDTFFSEINKDATKNKIYLGLLGTGKSEMNVMTRVSAVILRRIRNFCEGTKYAPEDLDPYFSLVTYFNSQRELGGASMGFKDSLPELIKRIKNMFDNQPDKTQINLNTEELTSRKPSGEIPDTLRKLENKWGGESVPIDLLLATNMLSVGVDISRLGSMIVAGQPKNNSEYIQATGRIGRNNPGLIITVYSYTKPRDLSHYENFKLYHSALFKAVESVSVTPFTSRTRDIALFGTLVGMIRMMHYGLSLNRDAGKFDRKLKDHAALIDEIKEIFKNRVTMVDPPEYMKTIEDIDKLIRKWESYRNNYGGDMLKYSPPFYSKTRTSDRESYYYLLKRDSNSANELIHAPSSMRNTEQEQLLFYMNDNTEGDER